MVKLDSFTTGAARFLSGITGVVSFWTGLAGRGAVGVMVGDVFCLSSGLSGEAGGTIWRSVLTDGICSWWMEAAFTTGTEERSATVPPSGTCPRSLMDGEAGCMAGFPA